MDGVYTADPEKDPQAVKFDRISYDEVMARGLKVVMDPTATALCRENSMPIRVFDMDTPGQPPEAPQGRTRRHGGLLNK